MYTQQKNKKNPILFSIPLIVVTVTISSLQVTKDVYPANIYVPDNYTTIQAAVNAATPGDVIIVKKGTYVENITIDKNKLTIKAKEGANSTIVLALDPAKPAIKIIANYVNFQGFTVKGGTNSTGILLSGAKYCEVLENILSENYNGISLTQSSNNIVFRNTIKNKLINSVGIDIRSSAKNDFSNNTISDNSVGISLNSSDGNQFFHNNILDNFNYGIQLYSSQGNQFLKNIISRNKKVGILLDDSSNNNFRENSVKNNHFGIQIHHSNNNFIYLNNFIGNTYQASSLSKNHWNSTSKLNYICSSKMCSNYLGNYWSSYAGSDANGDRIGDTPYIIGEDNDNYPLAEPYESFGIFIYDDFNDNTLYEDDWAIWTKGHPHPNLTQLNEKNNVLNIDFPPLSSYAGVSSQIALLGDFDIKVQWKNWQYSGVWGDYKENLAHLALQVQPIQEPENNVLFILRGVFPDGRGNQYISNAKINGEWKQSSGIPTADTAGYFRISREGSTIRSFFSTNSQNWINLFVVENAFTGPVRFHLSAYTGDYTIHFHAEFDDVQIIKHEGVSPLWTSDVDLDGLPDEWEYEYFGNLSQGPNDDFDHSCPN